MSALCTLLLPSVRTSLAQGTFSDIFDALRTALRSLVKCIEHFAQNHLLLYFGSNFGPIISRVQGTEHNPIDFEFAQ